MVRTMASSCENQDFYGYFRENMEALGLSVPASLFATQEKAVATLSVMLGGLKSLGKGATVAELVGATTNLEKLLVVGTLSASAYVGAAIGSLAVATGRYAACGATIADTLYEVNQQLRSEPWVTEHLVRNPEIYNARLPGRFGYAARAMP